jgi:hypothetical protein
MMEEALSLWWATFLESMIEETLLMKRGLSLPATVESMIEEMLLITEEALPLLGLAAIVKILIVCVQSSEEDFRLC